LYLFSTVIPNKEYKKFILSSVLLVVVFIDKAIYNYYLLPSIVLYYLFEKRETISVNKLKACNFEIKTGLFCVIFKMRYDYVS
jgi:hypothetical protein